MELRELKLAIHKNVSDGLIVMYVCIINRRHSNVYLLYLISIFSSSLFLAMLWVTYITFFNSRVVGSLTTSIINKFVKIGYIKVV